MIAALFVPFRFSFMAFVEIFSLPSEN